MAAQYRVEVAWDGSSYTDETDNCMAIRINRGRDGGPMGRTKVGTCDLTMRNDDLRFTPAYAGGALYGDLLPGRPVQVSALAGRCADLYGASSGHLVDNAWSADFRLTSQITVGAWIKWSANPTTDQYIICKEFCYRLRYYHTASSILWLPYTTGGGTYCGKNIAVNTTDWWHIVGTHDGATPKLYINGELVSSGSMSGPLNDVSFTQLCIGARLAWNDMFGGKVAYPFVSSRAFSESEVRAMYNHGAGYMMRDEHLRGYWTFRNQSAADDSGNGNTLTPLCEGTMTYPEATDLVSHRLFAGYTRQFMPDPATKTCLIRCVDTLSQMQRETQNLSLQSNKTTGELIGKILDDMGFDADRRIVDTGASTITVAGWSGKSAYDASQMVAEAEHGLFYFDPAGWAVFEDRDHRRKAPHTAAQVDFDGATLTGRVYYDLSDEDVRNHIVVRAYPKRAQSDTAAIWKLYTTPYLPNGGSLTIYAKYRDLSTGKTMKASDVTTPEATTDYTANSQADGGGADRTDNLSCAMTAYADQAELTYTASANLYITFRQLRGKLYEDLDVVEVIAEDATSQTNYGKRSFVLDNELIQDETTAALFANMLLARMKDPEARVRLEVYGHRDANHRDAVLRLGISDRIDITDPATGLNDASYFIEAIDHQITANGWHTTTYVLEPVVAEGYWILGVSKFDDETIVAF